MSLLIQYTILYASVLILVALGGCFSEHSGVINLGLEGIMVMGALGGALTMKYLDRISPGSHRHPHHPCRSCNRPCVLGVCLRSRA